MSDTASPSPFRLWAHLTAPEAAELAGSDPVAVLPLAAVEQHGPHLPLSTDVDIGAGILADAARNGPSHAALNGRIVVLPTLAVGTSTEHLGLPGTLSVSTNTLESTLVDTGEALARSGVRRLVVVNSHGGNKAVLDTAALRLRRELGMLVVKASWFRFPRPPASAELARIPQAEWEHGLHGGAVETAMMLYLHPERVRMEAAQDFRSLGQGLAETLAHIRPEGHAAFAWLAADLNSDGVTGNAALATPELGAELVRHYGGILREILDDALRFPLEALMQSDQGPNEGG